MFAKEPINSGRQIELDIARGLAVLFMILIHTQLLFATVDVSESWFGVFNDYVGGVPAAPMFMFLLGIGLVYSRKTTAQLLLKRGVILFGSAYLLNLLRGVLPNVVGGLLFQDPSYFSFVLYEFFYVDILQFAGLTLMSFALFRYLHLKNYQLIIFIVICSLLQLWLREYQLTALLPAAIASLFYGANEISYFPYLTWIFYPVSGYLFGHYLIRCQNKTQFYRLAFIIAAVTFGFLTWFFNVYLLIPNGMTSDPLYYHHSLSDQLPYTAFLVLELALLFFISQYLPTWFTLIAQRWSRNVTAIFAIHWLLLMWLTLVIPELSLSLPWFLLLVVAITLASDFLAQRYQPQLKKVL